MKTHPGARRAGRGAIAGLLAGAVAVGAGQLVAGITGAGGSPVVAVGQLQIDFTPAWLKNFAISEFGSHDKLVLVSGILVVLALFAAVLGSLAMRRLGYGLAGLAVFAVIGLIAAAIPLSGISGRSRRAGRGRSASDQPVPHCQLTLAERDATAVCACAGIVLYSAWTRRPQRWTHHSTLLMPATCTSGEMSPR